MLDHLTFTGRELLIFVILAVVLATVVYLLEVLLLSRRRKSVGRTGTHAGLAAMQEEIDTLKARIDALELRPPADSALDTQKTIHAEAVRMAREGASPQELADQLGISRTEADLIIALHKTEP
jgi:hypothetical protein